MISESANILDLIQAQYPQLAEPELQQEIAEFGKLMHFKAGEIMMDYGSYIRFVPLVVKGAIRVTREDPDEGRELLLYFLEPGEACSISFTCCMMNKKSEIRTEAEEDTTIIAVPIRHVDDWLTRYQSWKNFVMTTYDRKIIDLVRVIDSIAFQNLDKRMLEYLRKRVSATGNRVISATHQDLANDLNVTREAVSRLLKNLEKEGIVKLGRNQLLFKK
ncbi:MAG: Crp/Fnr family transcriptional regulator [Bacteroidetes bacterium]|nr:MAG: Crp/Fnr family transcriptional regulator [Bacteroidota bacterium]